MFCSARFECCLRTVNPQKIPASRHWRCILLSCAILSSDQVSHCLNPTDSRRVCIHCLPTHDIDHPSIRRHKWDHTMFGFLYRAVIGSVLGGRSGRLPVRHLCTNWAAAARLPFVYLGLAKDFWYEFDRYLALEKDVDSTFFVLPFKDKPGRTVSGVRAANPSVWLWGCRHC